MASFPPTVTLLFITVLLGASWRSHGRARRRPFSRYRRRAREQNVVCRGKRNQRSTQRRDEERVDRDASSSTASGRPSDDASEPMAGPSTSSGSSGRQEHGTSSGETTASARDAQNVATFAKPSRTTRTYTSEIVEEETDDAESCDGTPPMWSESPPSRAASPSFARDDPSGLRRDVTGLQRNWISNCCSFFSCFSTTADDDASSVDEVGDFPVHVTEVYHAGKKRKRVTKIGDYCDDPDAHDACKKLRNCSTCKCKRLCESFFDGKKKKFFKTCSDCRSKPHAGRPPHAARAADLSLCHLIDPHDDCDMERICNRCEQSLPCEKFFNPVKGKFLGGCRDCLASREEGRKNIRAAAVEAARSNPGCRGFTFLDCDGIAAVAASALTRLKA